MPTANPFTLTPMGDYVRDVAAVVCLLAALGMPWDSTRDGGQLWWVALPAVLALLALPVPYLMASRVLPTLTPAQSQLAKAAACTPLLVAVFVTVILDLTTIGQDPFEDSAGVGAGVAVTLAGLGLAVQPRATEEVLGVRGERAWWVAAKVTAVAAVALGVAIFCVFFAMSVTGSYGILYSDGDGPLFWIAVGLGVAVPLVVLAGLPAVGMAMGSAAARRALAVVIWTVLGFGLIGLAEGPFVSWGFETWRGPVGGMFALGVLAALVVSRPAQRATAESAARDPQWGETARAMLGLAALALAIIALGVIVAAVVAEAFDATVIALILSLVAGAVSCGTGAGLAANLATHRVPMLMCALVALVLGIVSAVLGVRVSSDQLIFETGLSGWDGAALFVLPVAAALVALVPQFAQSVRSVAPREAWTTEHRTQS